MSENPASTSALNGISYTDALIRYVIWGLPHDAVEVLEERDNARTHARTVDL